jgi:hypothetical protein
MTVAEAPFAFTVPFKVAASGLTFDAALVVADGAWHRVLNGTSFP